MKDIWKGGEGLLEIRPITLKDANEFVRERHRHNGPTTGHKFSVAVYDGDKLVGVGIVGRPVARRLDDGLTAEILRVCTDGTRNACSILYGACSRCAREMGYKRVVTYTLLSESGSSLKAAGFKNYGEAGGLDWSVPSRPRSGKYPQEKKYRWEKHYK